MAATPEAVWQIVVDVKPSVAALPTNYDASLVSDLGLDSLDLLQLGRRVAKAFKVSFVVEDWLKSQKAVPGKRATVNALVTALNNSPSR